MAISQITIAGKPASAILKDFIVDTEADIASLPTNEDLGKTKDDTLNQLVAVGSTALVAETSNVYILTPQNTWVVL